MKNIIKHPSFGEVRTEKFKGEFVFCAKDIYEVLDLVWKGSKNIGHLDEDEMLTRKVYTSGGTQDMIFVTESGLYALIIRSNKPAARKFRKWITSEVLPALRKYGTYSFDQKVMDRAKEKAARKAVGKMLQELDSNLSETDKRIVARQCQTDEYEVFRVLSGELKDAAMLTQCMTRATSATAMNKLFYTQEGAEEVTQVLRRLNL